MVTADFCCVDDYSFPKGSRGVGAVPKSRVVSDGRLLEETSEHRGDSVVAGIAVDATFSIGENCITAKVGSC